MKFEASVDDETCAMFNVATGEPLDAVAVIPGNAPDMELLVGMLTPEQADALARMAAWRSKGLTCDWKGFPSFDTDDLAEVDS